MTQDSYIVRQYRPNFFEGFETQISAGLRFEGITKVPFLESFKDNGFKEFTVKPYGSEFIIEAHYQNGEHYVAAFAARENSEVAQSWRYTGKEP